jgi:hypothetical protein
MLCNVNVLVDRPRNSRVLIENMKAKQIGGVGIETGGVTIHRLQESRREAG